MPRDNHNDIQIYQKLIKFAEDKSGKREVLTFLGEQLQKEQTHFWNRFTAIAALHAGLLVVAVETGGLARLLVCILGLVLAVLWFMIQRRSIWYVDRWKPMFHMFRKAQGLCWQNESSYSRYSSSTRLAMVAPIALLLPWLVLLYLGILQILTGKYS